jgi:hypothetical protein
VDTLCTPLEVNDLVHEYTKGFQHENHSSIMVHGLLGPYLKFKKYLIFSKVLDGMARQYVDTNLDAYSVGEE